MTFEESIQVGELQIQLKEERKKNKALSRELAVIAENEVWVVMQPSGQHLKLELCVSQRAIAQCKSLGEGSSLAYSIFCQARELIERAITGESNRSQTNDDPMV